MSASTSRKLLDAIRRGELPDLEQVRLLGENSPGEFFRELIEPLCDSFDPAQAGAYESLMRAFIPTEVARPPRLPEPVETVYVLSRVTLGADIKITSILLDAAKQRFPEARIVFVGGRKSAELFAADTRVEHLEMAYPRSGPVSRRIAFADQLRATLDTPGSLILDPDSRLTQLGLISLGPHHFHFPSRTAAGTNLTTMTQAWTEQVLGVQGRAWISPEPVPVVGHRPRVAVSLGVGENLTKRIGGSFERDLVTLLAGRFAEVWVDRGAGGEEAERVNEATENLDVQFWEGSFAGFASVIAQADLYVGYDSGAQHAAAALGVPVITVFAGAPNSRFRERWAAAGNSPCHLLDADTLLAQDLLSQIGAFTTART